MRSDLRGACVTGGLYKVGREPTFDVDGWFHTGDEGEVDGWRVHFRGRLGDMIKTAGANVAPAEVVVALRQLDGVHEAYVMGLADPVRGQVVAAAVVPEHGAVLDAEADPPGSPLPALGLQGPGPYRVLRRGGHPVDGLAQGALRPAAPNCWSSVRGRRKRRAMTATQVETVRGPVGTDQLGRTLMHEHVFTVSTEIALNYPELSWDGDKEARLAEAVTKLETLKEHGIDTIVDLTVLGLGRDVATVAQVNAGVDLHIVVATGLYTFDRSPGSSRTGRPGSGARPPTATSCSTCS